jgi:hypothetical protein
MIFVAAAATGSYTIRLQEAFALDPGSICRFETCGIVGGPLPAAPGVALAVRG